MNEPGNSGSAHYRIDEITRRMDRIEDLCSGLRRECDQFPSIARRLDSVERYNLGVFESELRQVNRDVASLRLDFDTEVKGLRRMFMIWTFSVVGSAIVFAFSVFALLGQG